MITQPLQRLKHRLRRPLRSRDHRQTIKDRTLARRLHAIFERDMELSDLEGFHFYVREGVVTLYGTIRHDLDQNLLLTTLRQVPGVKDVNTEKLEVAEHQEPSA